MREVTHATKTWFHLSWDEISRTHCWTFKDEVRTGTYIVPPQFARLSVMYQYLQWLAEKSQRRITLDAPMDEGKYEYISIAVACDGEEDYMQWRLTWL